MLFLGPPLSGKTTRLVEACVAALQQDLKPEQILCLTFFPANADSIRRRLKARLHTAPPNILALQSFQSRLLGEHAERANLPAHPQEISAPLRLLLIRQAWESVGGPLWNRHGTAPGAALQASTVIDWLSQNRARFDVLEGELSDHELARTYQAFIRLCGQRRVLTFQESSLRCLQLLEDEAVRAQILERFPLVLADDLHLARPDQLRLVGRLRGAQFTAAAWIAEAHHAPELDHVRTTIAGWGESVKLDAIDPGAANPAIPAAAARVVGDPAPPPRAVAHPIALSASFTVEEEMQGVAAAIVRALMADPSLAPSDILIAAADPALLPFASRVLSQYGLPAADPALTARHTPLVQGGLLVARWAARRDPETEAALMALPYAWIDPLDRSTLRQAAARLGRSLFTLQPDEVASLGLDDPRTVESLARLRQCLGGLGGKPLTASLIRSVVRDLGGLAWAWSSPDHPRARRDLWIRTFESWLHRVRELEATLHDMPLTAVEHASLIEDLADYTVAREAGEGIQLISGAETNGHSARIAFVIGLSENAAPVRRPEIQLLSDAGLAALFADPLRPTERGSSGAGGREVVLPMIRDQAAWIEREARAAALMLSRGRERLHVSVSRHTAAGDAQLPSPFFERLLGAEGEIDRDGSLAVHAPGLWRLESPDPASPERWLPLLDSGPTPGASGPAAAALGEHMFSASQLKMYLACPLQFFYGRVLGLEFEGAGYFDRGSLLHEVLCAALGDGRIRSVDLRDRPRPDWLGSPDSLLDRARAALEAAWEGRAVELPGGGEYHPTIPWHERFGPRLQRDAVRRWAIEVVQDWAAFEVEGLPDSASRRPILLEASFSLEMDGFRMVGRIDRIDEICSGGEVAYELIDYKTGSAAAESLSKQVQKFLPGPGETASDYQLPLYALALMNGVKELKVTPRVLRYVNLESLRRGVKGKYAAEATRAIELGGEAEVDYKNGRVPMRVLTGQVRLGILDTMLAMSSAPYPARPDFHCTYCSFRAACDRGKAMREAA